MNEKEWTSELLQNLPIKNILSGWTVENDKLYLIVMCDDGVQRTIILDKKS